MKNKTPWGNNDPLFEYLGASADISADLDFQTRKGFKNGVMVRPQSHGRVGLHIPTNTFLVVASKSEHNLRGSALPNGREQATKDGMAASYVVAAFRSRGDVDTPIQERPDFRRNARKQYHAFSRFCSALQANTMNQYHLRGFSFAGHNYFTNGDILYTISPGEARSRIVTLTAPVPRNGMTEGVAKLTGNNSFRGGYNVISHTLCVTKSNADARECVAQDWEQLSSGLWDETKDIKYRDMRLRKFGTGIYNAFVNHGTNIASAASLFGVAGYATTPNLGPASAFAGALLATVAHVMYSEGVYGNLRQRYEISRERNTRYDLENYGFGDNALNFFLDEQEIGKLAPKLSDRISALDIEWLTPDEMGWDRYNVGMLDTPLSNDQLARFLVRAPKIGISSEGSMARGDINSGGAVDLHRFQSGLVYLRQQLPDDRFVIYGQYRADVCRRGHKQLPEEHRDRLGDGITRVDIDPVTKEFTRSTISYEDMLGEVEGNLSESLNEGARYSILKGVGKSFFDSTQRRVDISQDPPNLFTLRSVVSPEPE